MFIIVTWDGTSEAYVVEEQYCGDTRIVFNFKSHQEAQDFIYNSANDTYLASKTKIVELN